MEWVPQCLGGEQTGRILFYFNCFMVFAEDTREELLALPVGVVTAPKALLLLLLIISLPLLRS